MIIWMLTYAMISYTVLLVWMVRCPAPLNNNTEERRVRAALLKDYDQFEAMFERN